MARSPPPPFAPRSRPAGQRIRLDFSGRPVRIVGGLRARCPSLGAPAGGTMAKPRTIGELRQSEYQVVSVKEEMRRNLARLIRAGEELFPGIVGYEETVVPQLENAVMSGQD